MNKRLCRAVFVAFVAMGVLVGLQGVALAAPANDAFAGATTAAPVPFSETIGTAGATTEAGEPSPTCVPGGFSSGASVWYVHASGATPVRVSISTAGSKYDTILAVYTGTGLGDLTQAACHDDTDTGSLQARLTLNAAASTTYYIQVSGFEGATGLLRFSLDAVNQPANDDFADATAITSFPYAITQSNVNASAESGEPGFCQEPVRTVWFKYVPATSSAVHVTATNADFEAGIHVWRGTSFANLEFINCFGFPSDGVFAAQAGSTYYLTVDSIDGLTGNFDFSADVIPSPANDSFASATVIPAAPFVTSADTQGATVEAGEPEFPSCAFGGANIGATVWYSFTPTEAASLVASAQGSEYDTMIAVYTGDDLGSLNEVGCNDDSGVTLESRAAFVAQPGTTYYIQVGGWAGSTGNLKFHLENGFILDLPTGSVGLGDDGERIDAHGVVGALVAGAGAEAQYAPGTGGSAIVCAGAVITGTCQEVPLP